MELTSTADGTENSFEVLPANINRISTTYSGQLQAFDSEGSMSIVEAG